MGVHERQGLRGCLSAENMKGGWMCVGPKAFHYIPSKTDFNIELEKNNII